MSVMMCSDDHLAVIAVAAMASTQGNGVAGLRRSIREMESRAIEHEAAVTAGDPLAALFESRRRELHAIRVLWGANRRAFAERYRGERPPGDAPTITAADFRRLAVHLSDPLTVLKLTIRYEYQACEAPDWTASTARQFCESAMTTAAFCLPGFDSRPAGL